MAFTAGSETSTDETHDIFGALCEHDGQEPALVRLGKQREARLAHGVPPIIDDPPKRIAKGGGRFLEGDSVRVCPKVS